MKDLWIRFGCFLTGYNYRILRGCSEAAFKAVKKYTAAMLIICILWFFIGFTFAQRYLLASIPECILAGAIAVVIIVQVEKQIILSLTPSRTLLAFRFCLALMMAILGSVIIDQILLQKDIETEKISYIAEKVGKLLKIKTSELQNQILALDTSIKAKEKELEVCNKETSDRPLIAFITTQTQKTNETAHHTDQFGKDSTSNEPKITTSIIKSNIPNPKISQAASLQTIIAEMRKQKTAKEDALLNIRPALEKEMKEKAGFLDELKVMVQLISSSAVALSFWLLWILFFLFIEMLVLFSKMGDKSSDYEKAVLHHMNLQIYRLDELSKGFRPANAIN